MGWLEQLSKHNIALLFSKLYKNDCVSCCCIDNFSFVSSFFLNKYDRNTLYVSSFLINIMIIKQLSSNKK